MDFLKNFLFSNITPKQTVLKNTFWLFLIKILSLLFKFFLFIFAARILGPYNFGSFQYVLSLLALFYIFSDLGINYLVIRDYYQKNNFKEMINTASFLREILLFISLLFSLIFSFFISDQLLKWLFIILTFYYFFYNFREYILSFFQAKQEMEKQFFVILLENFILLIFGFLLLFFYKNPIALSIAYILAIIFSLLFSLKLAKDFFGYLKPKLNLDFLKYYFINGLPLTFFGIIGFLFFSVDQIILGKLKGMEIVGYYAIDSRIVLVLNSFILIFLTALLPQIALNIDNKERMKVIIRKSFYVILFLGFFFFLLIYFLSDYLTLILGDKYLNSVYPLKLLSLVLLILPLISLFDNLLFILNKQWQNFYITFFCAFVNLILNFLLIPSFSLYGAIYATIISQILNLILTYLLLYKYFLRS